MRRNRTLFVTPAGGSLPVGPISRLGVWTGCKCCFPDQDYAARGHIRPVSRPWRVHSRKADHCTGATRCCGSQLTYAIDGVIFAPAALVFAPGRPEFSLPQAPAGWGFAGRNWLLAPAAKAGGSARECGSPAAKPGKGCARCSVSQFAAFHRTSRETRPASCRWQAPAKSAQEAQFFRASKPEGDFYGRGQQLPRLRRF